MSNEHSRVRLMRGDAVALEPIDWIWPGYLPAGVLTLLGGAPGCGKTAIALSLAATLTTGGPWPDGSPGQEAGDVILWSGEDPHSLSAAGLIACGADMQRVHFVERLEGRDADYFDPGRDMALLAATAGALKSPRLLILDPVVSAVAGDGHKNNQVRRSLQPVVDLGRQLGCGVIGITHFSKSMSRRDPLERITGSVAFSALPRLVLVAAKGQIDGRPCRVLVRAKSNIGPDEDGFIYQLERREIAQGITGQRVGTGSKRSRVRRTQSCRASKKRGSRSRAFCRTSMCSCRATCPMARCQPASSRSTRKRRALGGEACSVPRAGWVGRRARKA